MTPSISRALATHSGVSAPFAGETANSRAIMLIITARGPCALLLKPVRTNPGAAVLADTLCPLRRAARPQVSIVSACFDWAYALYPSYRPAGEL